MSDQWVELYHPTLDTTHVSQRDAYDSVWRHSGWVLLSDVAPAILKAVVLDPGKASDQELAIALAQAGLVVSDGASRVDRESLLPPKPTVTKKATTNTPGEGS